MSAHTIFPVLMVITDTFTAERVTVNDEQELRRKLTEESENFLSVESRLAVRGLAQRSLNFWNSRQKPDLMGFHAEVNGTSFSLYAGI